jgi:hypothetical protein
MNLSSLQASLANIGDNMRQLTGANSSLSSMNAPISHDECNQKNMASEIIDKKNQIIYIYIPIFTAFIWGLFSHLNNLDEKNLDIIITNIAALAMPPVFILAYFSSNKNKLKLLLSGILYIFISFIILNSTLFDIKLFFKISMWISIFNALFFLSIIFLHLMDSPKNKELILKIYNFNIILLIPIALLGYLLLFVGLLKIIYTIF